MPTRASAGKTARAFVGVDHDATAIEFAHAALGTDVVAVRQDLEKDRDHATRDATARFVWDGAAPMATWLCENATTRVRGKRVFELGAGPGLPGIVAASLIWRFALTQLGWPADAQELVDLLANADSAAVVALLVFLAIIVAPVTEEILFRAGLFRYLRTRTPRWLALILPGLIFGALHTNLAAFIPLVVLGVILALAYEHTGSILTPIVAHALFNLNTILLVVAGVPA